MRLIGVEDNKREQCSGYESRSDLEENKSPS